MSSISNLFILLSFIGFTLCACAWEDWQIRNYNQVKKIYENVQYPKNIAVLQNGPPPGLFAQNVRGRINPIGNFTDIRGVVEYFYALTPNVYNNLRKAALGKLTIVGFASHCPEIASFYGHVPICVYDLVNNKCGQIIGYIAQQGYFKFDENGVITHYDLILESFQEVLEILFGDPTTPQDDLMQTAYQWGVTAQVCKNISASCKGANQVYLSDSDCYVQLLNNNKKPFGYFWNAWSDTIACRMLHSILAAYDPAEHCPHCSLTGGGKCVEYPYNNKYFLDNVQLFGSESPFVCPGAPDE